MSDYRVVRSGMRDQKAKTLEAAQVIAARWSKKPTIDPWSKKVDVIEIMKNGKTVQTL